MRLPQPEKSNLQPGLLVILVVLSLLLTTLWYREGAGGPVHKVRLGVTSLEEVLGCTNDN